MADLAKLLVRIEADNSKLRAELVKTTGQLQKFEKRTTSMVTRTAGALKQLAGGFAIFQTAKAGLGQIVGFEKSLSNVQAVTGATADQMAVMERAARDLGASTAFSASEAAQGMEFLGRAGFDTQQIISAMPGLLDLAAAGALDLGMAADIASNVLSGFGLAAEESNRVADVLAATASKSNTNVEQLGEAMSYVAPVAAGLGVSVEEAAAAIGVLGNAGIQGSRAGTGLRAILATLADITPQARAAIEGLGLSVEELQSNLKDPAVVIRKLADAGLDATSAFEIFGKIAAPSIIALVDQRDGLRELTASLDQAAGTAERMAKVQLDNLAGDWEELTGAVEELVFAMNEGIGVSDALRATLQGVTSMVRVLATEKLPGTEDGGLLGAMGAEPLKFDMSLGSAKRDAGRFFDSLFGVFNERRRIALKDSVMGFFGLGDQQQSLPAETAKTGGFMEDGASKLPAVIDQAAESAAKLTEQYAFSNAELQKSVWLVNQQQTAFDELVAKTRETVNAKGDNPFIAGTVLQVGRDLDAAATLATQGKTDESIAKATKALDLIRQLSEQGQISDLYANQLINRAEELGGEAISGVPLKVGIDEEFFRTQAMTMHEVMQLQFAENPIQASIAWMVPNAAATPSLPQGATDATGAPIVFNLGGEDIEINGRGEGVDLLRTAVQREMSKRGRK